MKNDILHRQDIEQLVTGFYQKAMTDPVIMHFFTSVLVLDLKKHIPVIVNFWESILLGGKNYQGSPMTKHFDLHALSPMKKEHFDRWLMLWIETIDDKFEGTKATEAKTRAQQIAALMQLKINQ